MFEEVEKMKGRIVSFNRDYEEKYACRIVIEFDTLPKKIPIGEEVEVRIE